MIPPFFIALLVNRWTIGGLIALGLLTGAYFKGYWAAREACQDSALKAQIASMQRDLAAWQAADKVEAMLNDEIEASNRELEKKVQEYEDELSKRPVDGRCTLDQRDVDGLRGNGKR
jgi:hypothetical protein